MVPQVLALQVTEITALKTHAFLLKKDLLYQAAVERTTDRIGALFYSGPILHDRGLCLPLADPEAKIAVKVTGAAFRFLYGGKRKGN